MIETTRQDLEEQNKRIKNRLENGFGHTEKWYSYDPFYNSFTWYPSDIEIVEANQQKLDNLSLWVLKD